MYLQCSKFQQISNYLKHSDKNNYLTITKKNKTCFLLGFFLEIHLNTYCNI